MRILGDTRDLINLLERGFPATSQQFSEYLRTRNHELILTCTNVREFSGPLARGADFLKLRLLLQALEATPHSYLAEVTVFPLEIQAAVDAFSGGTEYRNPSPYVRRWDQTLVRHPGQPSVMDNLVNVRLDEMIYFINRSRPDVFAPPHNRLPRLRAQLQRDRADLRTGRAPGRQHFVGAFRRHANSYGVPLPVGREDEIANWVYVNPNRCPGIRLHHQMYRCLMANHTDDPETGDFSDLAQAAAIPYADAATLDRRMRGYCQGASRKLVRLGCTSNYADRVYSDLGEFMKRNP